MAKLELIYSCCTVITIEELSDFWNSVEISSKKLMIDPDQMQAIIIYIIARLNYPQIMTEVLICEIFLPPAVRKSSRFIYIEMIQAACSYLLS
jgi:hypothetical protein